MTVLITYLKIEMYLFIYVNENNSFSLVQLTQIMDINHFIIHYLLCNT